MQPERIRSLVEAIEVALSPGATVERVSEIAEAVLRSMLPSPLTHPGMPVAVLLHLPLHDLPDLRRASVEAHAWDRVTRIGGAVSLLSSKAFPAVPVRARLSSFAGLAAGVPEGDLAALAHRIDAAAADAGLDRVLIPWAALDETSPQDRRVMRVLPEILSAASRLHGMVHPGSPASAMGAPVAYGSVLARALRAGVLDVADRLLIGTPDSLAPPLPRIEAVVSAAHPSQAAELGDVLGAAVAGMSRRVAEWTGCRLAAPVVAVCADCDAASSVEAGPSGLPLRFRGWPVSASGGWGPVAAAELSGRLAALARSDLAGAFRIDDSPIPRSPASP